ncbi:hypothetical protein K1719_042329 [Acacia pycnantha]|nr:hypothetical protein K1719_042329 [Acacia pycnantha]
MFIQIFLGENYSNWEKADRAQFFRSHPSYSPEPVTTRSTPPSPPASRAPDSLRARSDLPLSSFFWKDNLSLEEGA